MPQTRRPRSRPGVAGGIAGQDHDEGERRLSAWAARRCPGGCIVPASRGRVAHFGPSGGRARPRAMEGVRAAVGGEVRAWRAGRRAWETPILARVSEIELDDTTVPAVVAALGSTQRPIAIDRARLEHQLREAALAHAAERLTDDVARRRRPRGEGRTAPRDLRADHGDWATDHIGTPDALSGRARIGACGQFRRRPTGFNRADAIRFVRIPILQRHGPSVHIA